MSEDPRADATPTDAPAAQKADGGKRRFLIRAVAFGTTVPVVMTIGRSASAGTIQSVGHSTVT